VSADRPSLGVSGGEFDLIRRHFARPVREAVLGGGDDCALLAPRVGMHWAVSSDMLVEGRHFFADVDPQALGHKALAVNLSDLAACGAEPRAFTLALSLPQRDDAWLAAFADGLYALANQHRIELVGGDTTAGPLNICITVMGEVPAGQALLRSGAQAGDDIWISGPLGEARVALEALQGADDCQDLLQSSAWPVWRARLERPQPRVALGLALRGIATAALDLSDGLLGDLRHVLQASGVSARLHWDAFLKSPALAGLSAQRQHQAVLTGGDDYELLFTAPPQARAAVGTVGDELGLSLQRVGEIVLAAPSAPSPANIEVLDGQGRPLAISQLQAFDHFATAQPGGGAGSRCP
jgi:thiamine-monophosphate kinase